MAMCHYFNDRLNALILLLKDSPFLFISSEVVLRNVRLPSGDKETCDSFKG